MITLPRRPMARLAIVYLGLKGLLRKVGLVRVLCSTCCGEDNCQDCRLQRHRKLMTFMILPPMQLESLYGSSGHRRFVPPNWEPFSQPT